MTNKRNHGLDLARLIAAYFVLFGHLIYGGTLSTDLSYVSYTGINETLPLLNKTQSLWMIDEYLLSTFNTALAIIGVGLFFIISGWIVPTMLHRLTIFEFLINRILRIYPMLIFAVLFAAGVQYVFGNQLVLEWNSVFSTLLLVNEFNLSPITLGVIWTLVIEVKFYIILIILGILSQKKLLLITTIFLALIFLHFILLKSGYYLEHPYALHLARSNIHDIYYIIFMFIGASFYLAFELKSGKESLFRYFIPIILLIYFNTYGYVMTSILDIRPMQELNIITEIIVFTLFFSCLYLEKKFLGHFLWKAIAGLSLGTYSLYLLHFSIGVFLLSRLRSFIDNQYILIVIVIVIVSILSILTFNFIEKPANIFAKKLFNYKHSKNERKAEVL